MHQSDETPACELPCALSRPWSLFGPCPLKFLVTDSGDSSTSASLQAEPWGPVRLAFSSGEPFGACDERGAGKSDEKSRKELQN